MLGSQNFMCVAHKKVQSDSSNFKFAYKMMENKVSAKCIKDIAVDI